jgi:hypothetical protein
MVFPITLNDKKDILRLNELATKESFSLKVSNGSIIIDAKSLLALFSLMGKTVNLDAPDSADPIRFKNFIKKIT